MNRSTVVTLVKAFGVNASGISKIQNGVYRVAVPQGRTYGLKRIAVSPHTLWWIDRSLQAVRRSGYARIGWRNPQNREGRRLFVQLRPGGVPYILIPWISGRWLSPRSRTDMRACGVALAHFHKAGRRFRHSGSGAVNKVGKWPIELRARHATISRLVNQASLLGKKRPMDRLLKQYGAEIIGYANKAQQLLRQAGYQGMCRTRRSLISLCHGDGGPTNFIMNGKGLHFIDFETLRIDLRAYDLYRVIYNCCKDHAWSFSIAKSFLDGFQSVLRLERADFAALRALLRFPQTIYLLLRRYTHTSPQGKQRIAREIPRALAAERKMEAFINQLDGYSRR